MRWIPLFLVTLFLMALAGCWVDMDGDGVDNDGDNCPQNANAGQSDMDGDGTGDVCDDDTEIIDTGEIVIDTGEPKEETWCFDGDVDGYGTPDDVVVIHHGDDIPRHYNLECGDCDDGNPAVHPNAHEECNGVDDDCNDGVDEDVQDVFYMDADGDGYGNGLKITEACEAPDGYVDNTTDCDDVEASSFPGNPEVCDGIDNDCDGEVDEDVTVTFYADADGDGHGNGLETIQVCEAPDGYVDNTTDCDDTDSSVHPGATERCNSSDDDCNGLVDDAVFFVYWYADADWDGFGDSTDFIYSCEVIAGRVVDHTDCDDENADANPDEAERCDDGIDNDCDGHVDTADPVCLYPDYDGDGYSTAVDCDDTSAIVYPGAGEAPYDGEDQDCDGSDWTDVDGDGYDADAVGGTDCDDMDVDVHPDADEYCDTVDNDCDGEVDEDGAVDGTVWYFDRDLDGYGADGLYTIISCGLEGPDYVEDYTDCDDHDDDVNPGMTEVCEDGVDNDCDGLDAECSE
ncbi:MAG: putative metal-binding motif-containing protein [Patescibacteria group bacterium]|jgi:hypothetical protein